jgi:two-component system, LuxR family, sensor kinase FixL
MPTLVEAMGKPFFSLPGVSEPQPPPGTGGSDWFWLHNPADVLTGLAFLALAALALTQARQRPGLAGALRLLGLFALICGFAHFAEAMAWVTPVSGYAAALKLVTVLAAWAAVIALVRRDRSAPVLPPEQRPTEDSRASWDTPSKQKVLQRFGQLLEAAPDPMLLVKQDGEILLVNSQTERLFGYSRQELPGKPADLLVPKRFRSTSPEQRSGYYTRPALGGPKKPPVPPVLYGLRKDGSEFPVEVSLSPLETTEETLYVSAIRDISERMRAQETQARQLAELAQAQEALRQQTSILQSILDSMGDGVIVADQTGKILCFNPAAEILLGIAPLSATPDKWTEQHGLFLPDGVTPYPAHEFPLARAMRGEAVDGTEIFVRPAGSAVGAWLMTNARPLRDEQGVLQGGVAVFHDMTGRKKAAEKMASFAHKLERSNRELQDFASVASHDLQEPLRKIQAFGDRLRAKCYAALDEAGRDYLERMQNAASRMRSLIDDLLTFSRVSSKAQPFVPTDLGQVAREVIQDLEVRIQHSGGQVEVDNLPTIDADPLQVRQLLQNLIGNGLKFHRQEEPPAIRVRARLIVDARKHAPGNGAPAPLCELSVEDNGIGFDMKYAERLFHVFQRLHGRGEYEGTGMGLAICRRIAERHGGAIAARAAPGRGATFTVTLPVKQPLEAEKVPGTFAALQTASADNGGVAAKVPDTFSSTEART